MKNIKIPFSECGQLVNYPTKYDTIVWKDNYRFDEIITLDAIIRGRSAAHFKVTDSKGNIYTLFMKDLFDACKTSVVKNGKIKGTFCFCKRGTNYGIKLIAK